MSLRRLMTLRFLVPRYPQQQRRASPKPAMPHLVPHRLLAGMFDAKSTSFTEFGGYFGTFLQVAERFKLGDGPRPQRPVMKNALSIACIHRAPSSFSSFEIDRQMKTAFSAQFDGAPGEIRTPTLWFVVNFNSIFLA